MPPRKTKVDDEDKDIDDSNFVRSTRPRKQVAPLGFDSSTKSKKPASETRVTRKRKGKEESESESEDEVIEDSSSSSGEEEEKPTRKTRGRRKSPRRKSPVPKSKYVELDEDEFDSEVSSASDSDEVEEESPKDAGKLIDLIVARRPRASAPLTASQNDAKKKSPKKSYVNWEYLVKAKNVAYLHAKWMLPEDLIQEFSNGKNRLTKFIREKVDEQEEARRERDNSNQYLFPPDYLLVDRIVDIDESDDDNEPTMLYVKWKSLGYDDCTWENKDDLLALVPNAKEKLELYERINSEEFFEQQKQPTPTRPKAKDDDSEDLAIPYKDLPRKDDDDESDKEDEDEEEEEDDSDNEKDDKKKKEKSKKSETKKNEDESQNIDIMEIDEEEPVDDGKPHRYRLKDYQETGFRWLVHCWYNRRSSILADEMGLGKTIQSAMMLQYLYREQGINGPFLIVAPMSTIEQWKRELELWTDLNVIILHGSADGRNLIFEKEFHFDGYSKRGATVYKVQAVITTYEVVMIESTRLKNIPWQYVIIDEGHKLKNSASKLFQTLTKYTARHKLILTGTPLQNGIKELWTLMNYLEPKKFDNVQDFLDEFGELRNTEQVAKLHKRLGPYMLRRTKEDVDASIPKKEETLVEIELSNTQKPYYKAIFDRNRSFLTKNAAKASLMNVMMQLRKCCNHPYLIRDAEDSITKDIHITHRRKDEEVKDEALFKRLVSSSSKFVFMDKLLTRLREKKQRVLIFSQMVKLLDILEDYMDYKGYPFVRLDGSIKRSDRQAAIDKFSNPDVDMFVFLLGTRAGGLGINLTIASTVIIFDSDWNPMNDLQAQARCHRIGQVNTVKVYRLITKNTYEKHMFNIASKKLGLDKVVMGRKAEEDNEGEEIVKGMSKDDIEKVLKYGAYALFSNNEKETNEEKEMDIDEILEHSTTVAYKSDPTNELSSFSKATFATEEENDGIDWDDEHFWDKLLPSFKTGNKISEILKNDVASLDKAEVRNQIMEDLKVLWDDAKFQEEHKSEFSTYDPIAQVAHILKKLNNVIEKFSEEHRKQIHDWSTVVEKPRLRSTRSSRRGADSDEEEPKKVQPQRGAKAAAAKEAKKPNEWAKAQRDRFKTALFQYGYGRWSDISTAAKLDSTKHVDEVQAFGENFVKQFLNEVETKEDEEEKEKKVVAAKTFYSVVIEDLNAKMLKKIKKGTELKEVSKDSDITMEMEGKSFIAGELFQVKIKGSHDNLHLLIKYTDESSSSTSYIVRYIPVEKDTVDVYAPGFFDGEYKMQLVSVETADNTTTVNVLDELEFIVCPNPLLQDSEMNACKMWLNKLFLLRDLILVNENYDIAKEKIPSLTIKDPASWWKSSDDRKLLTGIYKIGYGKYKELQEDKEYEWDTKSIESRTKSKDEKENAFPGGPALNKRLLKLTQEIIKRMERVEKREKDGKTEKKKDKENVDPEKKKVKQMKLDGKPSEEDDKKKKKSSDDKKKKSEDDEKKKKKKEDSDEKKKKEKKKSDDSDDKKKKKDDKEKKKRKKDSDDKDKKEKKEKKAKKEKKSKEEKKAADDKKPSPNPLSKRRKLVQPGLEIFLKKSNDEIVPV